MFAPVVTSGARLAAIRRRLHVLAEEAGFALTYRPVLTALAAGEFVSPEIVRDGETRLARFAFPRPVRDIKLISAANRPAETDPGSEDWRALSLCVLPPPGAELGPGWLAPAGGDRGVWMGRVAALRLAQPTPNLALRLAAVVQSWVPPRHAGVDAKAARR